MAAVVFPRRQSELLTHLAQLPLQLGKVARGEFDCGSERHGRPARAIADDFTSDGLARRLAERSAVDGAIP